MSITMNECIFYEFISVYATNYPLVRSFDLYVLIRGFTFQNAAKRRSVSKKKIYCNSI